MGNHLRNAVVTIIALSFLSAALVSADPSGPNIFTIVNSSRAPLTQASSLVAWAGNITQLNIAGSSTTKSWAGYFGNVSGYLTLSDSNNRSLFNWTSATPLGEIYATTSQTINWSQGNIRCWNFTQTTGLVNLTQLENEFNISPGDGDGVDETFSFSGVHSGFFTGLNEVTANTCPRVSLFNGTGVSGQTTFQEVILEDQTYNKTIFATPIENNKLGFTNELTDFELIVPEDGHYDSNPTTYYFYVEIG